MGDAQQASGVAEGAPAPVPPFVPRLQAALGLLNRAPWARSVRDGMVWLVPYLMLWSAVLLLGEALHLLDAPQAWVSLARRGAAQLRDLLPPVIWGAMGAMAALHFSLARTPVAYVCLAAGVVVQAALTAVAGTGGAAWISLLAMTVPFPMVGLMASLSRRPAMHLAAGSSTAGHNVSESLNLVLPALAAIALTTAAVATAGWLLTAGLQGVAGSLWSQASPTLVAALYTLGNSLAWLFGVHGYYLLLPLLEALPELSPQAGEPVSQTFLGVFVFIGGAGSTLSLILVLLLQVRKRSMRVIGLMSLLPAAFNVNELLLFGLPIILNPHLLLPFVLVPLCNFGVAAAALQWGWVAPIQGSVPFNSPVMLNALLATRGDAAAVLLQVANVALGAVIYWPFVARWVRQAGTPVAVPPLHAIDTEYSRRAEEASFRMDDPVRELNESAAAATRLNDRLRALDDHDFVLYYQPKVNPQTGQVMGSEALLRLVSSTGAIVSPGAFLPDLERAGLMKDVDQWVARAAAEQLERWRQSGEVLLPVSVNVSADTLMDLQAVHQLAREVSRQPGLIDLELTEGAFLSDQQIVSQALEALGAAGARLDIDDFGTGFSSLSYLYRFKVDGIKIDRSFTSALAYVRGREVFSQLCAMARRLNLRLVVEGVEEAWQLRHLPEDVNVSVQGFLFARPMPADQFQAYVAAQAGRGAAARVAASSQPAAQAPA